MTSGAHLADFNFHYQIYIHYFNFSNKIYTLNLMSSKIKSFVLNLTQTALNVSQEEKNFPSLLPSVGDDRLLRDKIKSSLCSSREFIECFCKMSDARLQSLKLDVCKEKMRFN